MLESAKQLNYDDRIIEKSGYRIVRQGPTIGNGSYTFGNSNNYVQLEVQAGVINPSKLAFQGQLSLVGSTGVALAHASYFPYINRIEVTASNGVTICSISNMDKYTKAAGPLMANYKERSNVDGFLFPSERGSVSSTTIYDDNYLTTTSNGTTSGAIQPESMDEMSYFDTVIPVGTVVASQNYLRNHSIPFSRMLFDTWFNLNEDFHFAGSIIIKLYMSTLQKVGICIANGTNPTIGHQLTSATYTNLGIQIFYQMMPEAIAIAEFKSRQGYVVACPYVCSTGTVYSGSSQNGTFHLQGPALDPLTRIYKYYYLITFPDTLNSITAGDGSISVTDSSNVTYAAGPPQASRPKLWIQCQAQAPNKGQFITLDTSRNEEISLINAQYKDTSFNSESSYKICGVLAYTFDDAYTMKYYDGKVFVGDTLGYSTAYDLQHNFTVPVGAPNGLTNSQLEHNIFAVFIAPLYHKDGKCSWNSAILASQ